MKNQDIKGDMIRAVKLLEREDKVMKRQQQVISIQNSDNVKSDKSFIPDKYNNQMELKKLKRIKYFSKALLEIRAWECVIRPYWYLLV